MARHQRYNKAARLSARRAARAGFLRGVWDGFKEAVFGDDEEEDEVAVSAAFDETFSFYTPEAAQTAAEIMWSHFKIKARAVGNVVHYEDPGPANNLLDDVTEMLEQLLDEDAQEFDDADEGPTSWTDEDGDWEVFDDDLEFEPPTEWTGVESGWDTLGEDVDDEPPIEEPPADYVPPALKGPWKPRGPWIDLVIDYSQLPDDHEMTLYAHKEMAGLDEEQLVDLAENLEGAMDRDSQKDFIATLFAMAQRSMDEVDSYWDYMRAYRYAQQNKGAGLSRLLRRVKQYTPTAEAGRRTGARQAQTRK